MTGIRQARQQRTRARLLDAAETTFAARGYDGATIPEIARAADCSTGAIYANFSGKEELFLAVMLRVVTEGAERREGLQTLGGGVEVQLRAMVDDWVATIDGRPEVMLLLAEYWLHSVRRPELRGLAAQVLGAARTNLAATVARSVDGVDEAQAAELGGAVQALAYGYAMQRLVEPDAVPAAGLARAVGWLVAGATGRDVESFEASGTA